MAAQAVLWDLDGTLTNPFLGITNSIRHALRQVGREAPEAEELRRYIGPPLQVTLGQLLGTDDPALAAEALGHYRAIYAEKGKFENELIAGIAEALEAVRATGARMFVATSKLETYSVDIVRHFGLEGYFGAVYGSQWDGSRADKGELIRFIMAEERLDPARTVMIGDRLHDVHGAAKNGVGAIGVLWGFGDRAELGEAGALAIAERPDDLPGLIGDLFARA